VVHVLVGLHVVDHAADVGVELFLDGHDGVIGEVEPLGRADLAHEFNDVLNRQLVEAEADEFGLQRFVNAADVVAYEAKPHVVLGVVVAVQQVAQGGLCVLGHVVHFIQNDELGAGAKERPRGDEAVDLIADDVNAALVGSVQVDHEPAVRVVHGGSLVLVHEVDDGGGFAGAGGAVKQQVGEMPGGDDVAQHELVERVQHNVIKVGRPVFFHPRRGIVCIGCTHSNSSGVIRYLKHLHVFLY